MKRLNALLITLFAVAFGAGWLFRDQDEVLKAKLVFANIVNGTASSSVIQIQPNLAQSITFQDTAGNHVMDFSTTTGQPVILQYYPETLSGTTGVTATGATEANATNICFTTEMVLISAGSATNSVSLPDVPAPGQHCMLKNQTANGLWLWGGSGGTLCVSGSACGSAAASGALAARTQLDCYADPPGGASPQWECR